MDRGGGLTATYHNEQCRKLRRSQHCALGFLVGFSIVAFSWDCPSTSDLGLISQHPPTTATHHWPGDAPSRPHPCPVRSRSQDQKAPRSAQGLPSGKAPRPKDGSGARYRWELVGLMGGRPERGGQRFWSTATVPKGTEHQHQSERTQEPAGSADNTKTGSPTQELAELTKMRMQIAQHDRRTGSLAQKTAELDQ